MFPFSDLMEKNLKFEFIKKLKKIAKKIKVIFDSNIGFKNKKLGDLVNNGKEHLKKFNRKNFIKGFEEIILNNQN